MNKLFIKKCIIVAIFFILINLTLETGISAYNSSFNDTIYVDDIPGEGPDNPPEDYIRIQDAIDNVSDGDTVFVYNGIYYENIVINKSIDLIGEDKNLTIIDCRNVGFVFITSDNVFFSNFTLTNCSTYGIKLISNNNTIKNNIILNINGIGIFLYESNYNTILNNYYINNKKGIYLDTSSENHISRNLIINNNDYCIFLWASKNNIISENTITDSDNSGIVSEGSSDNYISNNNISNNDGHGIMLFIGHRNKIISNYLENNRYAVRLYMSDSTLIKWNTIKNNEYYGIHFDETPIIKSKILGDITNKEYIQRFLHISNNEHIISENNISNNLYGIYLNYNCESIISNNTISNNSIGIFLKDYSNINTISKNSILNNNEYGIYLIGSSLNSIVFNNFIKNNKDAYFENCENTWSRNYWNRPRILPYLIFGKVNSIISIDLDWRPKLLQNEIL